MREDAPHPAAGRSDFEVRLWLIKRAVAAEAKSRRRVAAIVGVDDVERHNGLPWPRRRLEMLSRPISPDQTSASARHLPNRDEYRSLGVSRYNEYVHEATKCASKKSVFFSKIKNWYFCLFFRANLTVLGVLVGSAGQ
jgi:hypothetical protein